MILGNIKKRVLEWKKTTPRKVAERRLIATGISLSVAQKLLAGTYKPNPKQSLEAKILKALSKKAS